MIKDSEVYRIGTIGKTHGVKGELSVQIDDDVFDRVDADHLVLKLDGILVPFFMEEYRFKSDDVVLMKFEGIDTQERAREFTGTEVYFERSLASTAADADDEADGGYVSLAMLVGFTLVNDSDGRPVGTITSYDDSTVNILFEIDGDLLIPYDESMVTDFNPDEKTIRMNLPEGILEVNG